MNRNKIEKYLKVIGIIILSGGIINVFVLMNTTRNIEQGNIVILIPAWLIFIPTIATIMVQILAGIFAIKFRKTEKITYCLYAGIALCVCIIINAIVTYYLGVRDFLQLLLPFLLPMLYTTMVLLLINFRKIEHTPY